MRACIERLPDGSPCPRLTRKTRCMECEAKRQRTRNVKPERAIYRGDWPAESRAIRAAQPWCSVRGCTNMDLSVDHPSRSVYCLSHHSQLEARRRANEPTEQDVSDALRRALAELRRD